VSETPNLEFDVIAQHFKMVRYKGLLCFVYIYYITYCLKKLRIKAEECVNEKPNTLIALRESDVIKRLIIKLT